MKLEPAKTPPLSTEAAGIICKVRRKNLALGEIRHKTSQELIHFNNCKACFTKALIWFSLVKYSHKLSRWLTAYQPVAEQKVQGMLKGQEALACSWQPRKPQPEHLSPGKELLLSAAPRVTHQNYRMRQETEKEFIHFYLFLLHP